MYIILDIGHLEDNICGISTSSYEYIMRAYKGIL